MQISATSTAYGGGQAQRLLAQLLQSQADSTGQDLPGETEQASAPRGPPPGPPPSGGGGGGGFAADTLSGLLSTQEAASPADDLASKVISAVDTDGDGVLSQQEIQAALGADSADSAGLGDAIAKLDADGDSKLSASELSAGIETQHAKHGHRPPPPTSADLAATMIGDVDADGDGTLNAAEVQTALGGDETTSADSADGFASAFGKLDADSDGQLTAAELTAALDAFRAAQASSYAAGATEKTTSVSA